MTDLAHLAQLLHETAHRERFGLPALLDWLREERTGAGRAAERNRRLDSDAAAVQIMTVWVSKGLQYPLVYLPFAFNRHVPTGEAAALPRATAPAASTSAARAAPATPRTSARGAPRWPATTSG